MTSFLKSITSLFSGKRKHKPEVEPSKTTQDDTSKESQGASRPAAKPTKPSQHVSGPQMRAPARPPPAWPDNTVPTKEESPLARRFRREAAEARGERLSPVREEDIWL